jgi:hypothetical protein
MSRSTVVRGARRETRLPAGEARLLTQINKGFADAWWAHYHELVAKRQRCLLSAAEHRELIRLTDQLENREAKRLKALVKLAKLRKQSLADLMTALGLVGKTDG